MREAALVGGQVQGSRLCVRDEGNCATQSHNFPHPGRIACCPTPDRRPPATKALHTICGNNTSIVSSSWWWAYMCPKHVEQIISAIKHSVACSWVSSLRLYYDARTNLHHISLYGSCLLPSHFTEVLSRVQSSGDVELAINIQHWTVLSVSPLYKHSNGT